MKGVSYDSHGRYYCFSEVSILSRCKITMKCICGIMDVIIKEFYRTCMEERGEYHEM